MVTCVWGRAGCLNRRMRSRAQVPVMANERLYDREDPYALRMVICVRGESRMSESKDAK